MDLLSKRAWEQAECRALDQARRVPWRRLAEAADEYTNWHIFTLWLRAVVDAARAIPEIVETELENRAPHALEPMRTQVMAALRTANRPGARLWSDMSQWVETNVFLAAKTESWLDAVHYFSSVSIRSMKAWAHWERTEEDWQKVLPAKFPTYEEWRTDVDSVNKLSNPESVCQQVVDAMNRVPPQNWKELETGFFDLTVFSLWMELVIEFSGPNSSMVKQQLHARYKGFESADDLSESKVNVRALNEWALSHQLREAKQRQLMPALSYQVRNHPRYHALRRYAQHCYQAWQEISPPNMPSFEEWIRAGAQYVECGVRPC